MGGGGAREYKPDNNIIGIESEFKFTGNQYIPRWYGIRIIYPLDLLGYTFFLKHEDIQQRYEEHYLWRRRGNP